MEKTVKVNQKNEKMVVFGAPRNKLDIIVIIFLILVVVWYFPLSFEIGLLILIYFFRLHFHDCHFGLSTTGLTIFYRDRFFGKQKNYPWSTIKKIEIFPSGTGLYSRNLILELYSGRSAYADYVIILKGNGETQFVNELKKYVPVVLHSKVGL